MRSSYTGVIKSSPAGINRSGMSHGSTTLHFSFYNLVNYKFSDLAIGASPLQLRMLMEFNKIIGLHVHQLTLCEV